MCLLQGSKRITSRIRAILLVAVIGAVLGGGLFVLIINATAYLQDDPPPSSDYVTGMRVNRYFEEYLRSGGWLINRREEIDDCVNRGLFDPKIYKEGDDRVHQMIYLIGVDIQDEALDDYSLREIDAETDFMIDLVGEIGRSCEIDLPS